MRCRLRLLRLEAAEAEYESIGKGWLTDAERRQLDATSATLRRRQFLAGHWLARRMAADALGGAPEDWTFDVDTDGRRRVARAGCSAWVCISHWTDWVACALAEAAVGLDVQGPDRGRDITGIGREVLSPTECAEVEALQGEAKTDAFYRFWTLKEARAKWEGKGLRPELARAAEVRPCEPSRADAFSWRRGQIHIALCVSPSSHGQLDVSPDLGPAEAWRFQPLRTTR